MAAKPLWQAVNCSFEPGRRCKRAERRKSGIRESFSPADSSFVLPLQFASVALPTPNFSRMLARCHWTNGVLHHRCSPLTAVGSAKGRSNPARGPGNKSNSKSSSAAVCVGAASAQQPLSAGRPPGGFVPGARTYPVLHSYDAMAAGSLASLISRSSSSNGRWCG